MQHRWWHGVALTLGVSVPCLVAEEGWHRRALIDWSLAWVPFAVAVAVAFVAGGALAGASARRGRAATVGRGLACGLASIACLLVGDFVRRDLVVREALSFGVVELWLIAGGGAVALAGLGAGVTALRRSAVEQRLGSGHDVRRRDARLVEQLGGGPRRGQRPHGEVGDLE